MTTQPPEWSGQPEPSPHLRPPLPPHPKSTMVLIVGLLSVFLCSLLGPVAWVMGGRARKEVRQNPSLYREDSVLTIGWILGIVATALFAMAVAVMSVVIAVVLFADIEIDDEYSSPSDGSSFSQDEGYPFNDCKSVEPGVSVNCE